MVLEVLDLTARYQANIAVSVLLFFVKRSVTFDVPIDPPHEQLRAQKSNSTAENS